MKTFLMILSALNVAAHASSGSSPVTLQVESTGASSADGWAPHSVDQVDPCAEHVLMLEEKALDWALSNSYQTVAFWEGAFEAVQCVITPGEPTGQKGKSKTCAPDTCACTWEPPCADQCQSALTCASHQCVQKHCGSWEWQVVAHPHSKAPCELPKHLNVGSCLCECDQAAKSECLASNMNWCDETCQCHCPTVDIPCSTVNEQCECSVTNHGVSQCFTPMCSEDVWVRGAHVGCPEGETELESPVGGSCCEPCGQQTGQKGQKGGARRHRGYATASVDAAGLLSDFVPDSVEELWDYTFGDGEGHGHGHHHHHHGHGHHHHHHHGSDDSVDSVQHTYDQVHALCDAHNVHHGHPLDHNHSDPVDWTDIVDSPSPAPPSPAPPVGFVPQTGKFCVNVKKFLTTSSHGFTMASGSCDGACGAGEECMACEPANGYKAFVLMKGGLPGKCIRDMYGNLDASEGILYDVGELIQSIADSISDALDNVITP